MLKAIAAALGAALLAGCSSAALQAPPMRYAKAGATQDGYLQDRYQCLQQAREQRSAAAAYEGVGTANSQAVVNGPMFDACMAARGYRLDPNGPFAPPAGAAIATVQ